MNPRTAIMIYQFTERTKSQLLIASRLIEDLRSFESQDRVGATRIVISLLEALRGELTLAYNVTKDSSFLEAERMVKDTLNFIVFGYYIEALSNISEAIVVVTSCGLKATKFLVDEGLL